MQFHYVVAVLTALSTALAVPTGNTSVKRDCDIAKCVTALAPTVLGCVRAAAALGVDFFANANCLVAATNVVVNMPAACDSCLEEFGILEKIKSAGQAIKSVAGDVKHKAEDIADDIKDKAEDIASDISHELTNIFSDTFFPH